MKKCSNYIFFLSLFVITNTNASEVEISNKLFSGSVEGYIQAFKACKQQSNKRLFQGEYETLEEFKARKKASSSNCNEFQKAKITTPWKLNYKVNEEHFVLDIPETSNIDLNTEFLYKIANPSKFTRRWDHNKKPSNYGCRRSGSYGWKCWGKQYLNISHPRVKLYNKEIKKVNFDIQGEQYYSAYMEGSGGDDDFHQSKREIKEKRIKLIVPIQGARSLKAREQDLFLRFSGTIELKKNMQGLKMNVERLDIYDGSVDNKFASLKRAS